MKRLTIVVVATALALALTGPVFAAPFAEGSVPDGKALVYVYRTADLAPALTGFVLAKDGPIGILPVNSYCPYVAEPGTIRLWLTSHSSTDFKTDVAAGQIYYVKGGFGVAMFGVQPPFLKIMSRETAMKELSSCKRVNE